MHAQRAGSQPADKGAGGNRTPLQALVLLLALAAAVTVALLLMVTPAVVPASAPATQFSAERAMEDVRVIAGEPHPMGSPEHEEVADYIVGRLRELGLSPQVQETTGLRYDDEGVRDQVQAARVKNILARIPGTDSTGAVLLAGHYDSMPTTNAAADGGLGTATLIETVRAIQAGQPPKNDVIVYVGDSDVNGVLGPIAYQEHPWYGEARVGFAFEGIGSYGPSALVYSGQGVGGREPSRGVPPAQVPTPEEYPSSRNGWWLGEALEVLPHPFVILPLNDTPFAVATSPELGLHLVGTDAGGLGFGQFRGTAAYHTILDNPERLDRRALQQAGENTLALTRHFGDLPLDRAEERATPSLVAFNVLPGRAVAYPSTWALPLAAAVAALLVALLVAGLVRKRLRVSGLLVGAGLFVVSVIGAVAVTALAWKLGAAANPAYRVWMGRGYYGADWRLLCLASLTVASVAALYLLARRYVRVARDEEGVAAGALVILVLLAVLTGVLVPSLSYLFVWPTLAGVLVLCFALLVPARAQHSWPRAVVLAVTAFAPTVLFVPAIYLFYAFFAAPFAGSGGTVPPVVMPFILLALMLGALVPHLRFLGGRRRWLVPVAFAALALAFFAGELAATRFGADRPRPDYVQYRLDADTGKAAWISDAIPPDAWTRQFFESGYTRGKAAFAPGYFFGQEFEAVRAPAPALDLSAPRLEVLEDATHEGARTLRLRLTSPRGATYAHLDMDLPGEWVRASVDGQELSVAEISAEGRRGFALTYYNLPEGGVEIVLSVRSTGAIDATLTDYSNGLPEVPGMEIEPRPPEFMPAPYDIRDPTAVSKSWTLSAQKVRSLG